MNAVVLFDIDGTLLRRAGPHHRRALEEAVRQVTGLDTTVDGIPVHGMLDREILRQTMRRAGATEDTIHASMAAIVETAQSVYLHTCPDLRRKVCPGARLALRRLAVARIPAGLVTGNLSAIGWRKMEQAGLRRYFRFGAFAEEAETRAGLARLALAHARRAGWVDSDTRITLIGDHGNDVLAAKLNKVRSIAVATGLLSRSELAAFGPDIILPDLRCLNLEKHL